jgi:hypothetical protein
MKRAMNRPDRTDRIAAQRLVPNRLEGIKSRKIATGIIKYKHSKTGVKYSWSIGCLATETEEDLKMHLKRWLPDAIFISGKVIPDKS